MTSDIFSELSIVIVLVTLVSLVMRLLRQPLILGYIITGVLVGPSVFHLIHSKDAFEGFSSIGISLLLFIIGLGLNVNIIRRVGKPVFVTAGALLVVIGSLGAIVGHSVLGLKIQDAYIIGLSLFFSSTIIIVKALSDKKEQNRLYGQIAIGVILLDDIVATLALLFVAAGKNGVGVSELGLLGAKGIGLVLVLIAAGKWLLPWLVKTMAISQEGLFLFAIAWGFGIATLFDRSGFSIEVGSLFAGVSLASLPYAQEIESRLKPLRDFFVVLFFITLGESLTLSNLQAAIIPALILSFVVIALKPAAVTITLGMLGYPKRVAFKAGIHLSQISEFSIVLVVLAVSSGLVSKELSAIITLVTMITITSSTYLTQYDNQLFTIFDRLKTFNGLFNSKRSKYAETHGQTTYPLLLFGYHRGGRTFIKTFKDMRKRFLVVDYDPTAIEDLQRQQIPSLYGDATDPELLEEIGVPDAKLIVSTISDFETNQELVKHVNFYNPDAVIVCNANSYEEAMQLYELGCSYVVIPHHVGNERLSYLIQKNGIDREHFDRYRRKHLQQLELTHPLEVAEEAI